MKSVLWSGFSSAESARRTSRVAACAAWFVAVATGGLWIYLFERLGKEFISMTSRPSLTPAIMFALIGCALWWRQSRVAAVAGFLYYLDLVIHGASSGDAKFVLGNVIFLLCFLYGMRATFAFHSFVRASNAD